MQRFSLLSLIQSCFKTLSDVLVPRRCNLCNQIAESGICQNCCQYLEFNPTYCYQCGRKLPKVMICGDCLKNPHFFDLTLAPFLYEGQIAKLIKQSKFNRDLAAAQALAQLLIGHLKQSYIPTTMPKALVYVPSHHWEQRWKGMNLAELLAQDVSKALNLPLFHLVQKIKKTPPQHQLKRAQRLKNLSNAFEIDNKAQDKLNRYFETKKQAAWGTEPSQQHIALIDDVMTTGATANEIAKLIKSKTTVSKIDVWILARSNEN